MFKSFIKARFNGSNLTICLPQKLVTDWNENTRYDGNYFYIRKNISKSARCHIAVIDRYLRWYTARLGEDYEINPSTTLKLDRI